MKNHRKGLRRRIVLILIVVGIVSVVRTGRADDTGQKAVEETRQALRQQGFKTDLADFDFSTSPEMRDREALLIAANPERTVERFVNYPNLMEAVGSNSAVVVWKLSSVKKTILTRVNEGDEMTWEQFRENLGTNQSRMDAACAAILSGPIRFNLIASHGNAMMLPHVVVVKNLIEMFGSRTVLALHDGKLNAAWTNLMAATRLVTAWETEPAEVSHVARFGDASLVFDATWQALQTNGWRDEQLAQLQAEWEPVNFFARLPETAAFKRASDVDLCAQERQRILDSRPEFSELFNEKAKSPPPDPAQLEWIWRQTQFAEHGSYEDQKALLLFYRDREIELRNAVKADTWLAMRRLPGVTNIQRFQSTNGSSLQVRRNQREMAVAFQSGGAGLLGYAAKAEAQRRVIIAALALERFHVRHGKYPDKLSELTPDSWKTPLADFMDGEPLHYRRTEDGHFLLYSVGLDGVDDGGQMVLSDQQNPARFVRGISGGPPKGDLVWPLPAPITTVEAIRVAERKEQAERAEQAEMAQAENQWNRSAHHQAGVDKFLPAPASTNLPDPMYNGHHLSELLQGKTDGTNRLTLREMLTLKQVLTGAEPETVTFNLPINYNALAAVGGVGLFIDTNNDDSDAGCNVQQMECKRADDGNCLLVWSTIYESPGKHALQAGLEVRNLPPESPEICGPAMAFTNTSLCEFSISSATFEPEAGATFLAKLPEKNGRYVADMITTGGALLKSLTGGTSNGVIRVYWDLIDAQGKRFAGDEFKSIFHITLPDSGRSQTIKGP